MQRETPLHALDARVKLVLLLAYSITLFMVHTWIGIGICLAACALALLVGRIPLARVAKFLIPVSVILLFTLVFNSFTFDVAHVAEPYGLGAVSPGVLEGVAPITLFGSFGFVPEGFARGSFYVLRIILLVVASLVLSFTTASTDLTNAINSFLKPLRVFKVPTSDIAMIISIALRFIPLTAEELSRIQSAQWARGASFGEGNLFERLRAWQAVLIPMFVGLFRRADNLALAMEARCYGGDVARTELNPLSSSASGRAALLIGLLLCVAVSVFL